MKRVISASATARVFLASNAPTPGTDFSYLTGFPLGSWIWRNDTREGVFVAEWISSGTETLKGVGAPLQIALDAISLGRGSIIFHGCPHTH